MPDALGYRAKVGVLVPSTNTILEPELYAMGPGGVTFHISRMYVPQASIGSPSEIQAFVNSVRAATEGAIRDVLTLEPDWLIHGFTALSFMCGTGEHGRLRDELEQRTGVRVSTGAEAVVAALQTCGAETIAVVTPQPELIDQHYARFFAESGIHVADFQHIPCRTAVDIGRVDQSTLRAVLMRASRPHVDAIVCVAADLAAARLADEAERWLQTPVVSMSTALLWHTLRGLDIADQLRGFGFLLREH
jgi:maleate isomerase